jgi:hypothetical protein
MPGISGGLAAGNYSQDVRRMRSSPRTSSAESQLRDFIRKFDPDRQRLIRAARRALRARWPSANELVYDNYNFFVIGFSPTERPSDAVISIAAGSAGVSLCFIHGATLADPKKLLSGGGKQTRFLRLESAQTLATPDVDALLRLAEARCTPGFPHRGKGRVVIRSISTKQRPRKK